MNTDTCPDCSEHPCDCGMPAGYTLTPRTETDLFEATKVSLEYGNQRLFKKSQSTRIVGEVAFSDGYEYALKHSSKIKQLERELTAARRLAEKYRNLSCQDQDQADATLLPWETNQSIEP